MNLAKEQLELKQAYVAANTSRTPSVKWDGISLLNNFQYEEKGVRAWRAFNVGPGKLFPWATFEGAAQLPEPLQVLDPSSQSVSGTPTFRTARHRYVKKTSVDSSAQSLSEDSVTEQEQPMLFPCPEEGCVKAYSHFTYLQAHLDTGRHKMVLEQETLYDKAMKLYACKLTEGHDVRIPSLESNMQTGDGSSPLKKGWALKTIKKRARFSDKHRQYLTEQFQNGEESGRKCDPKEVSKSMGLERDQGGARIFHPDEVLTAQQITVSLVVWQQRNNYWRQHQRKAIMTAMTQQPKQKLITPLCAQMSCKVSLFSIRLCHPLSMYVSLFEGTN